METRTVEQVESWNTRSFADGFSGLRELSDGEFSGALRAGGAWLFMLNGRIIGVHEGTLDDFETADGTAYAAPHPSLPLLFSMREQGGETQAKYYTNDTPLSEVDSTLSQGNFTGYVELSENVLSGDYYVAYYGGRSMSVAFVGASEQVVTGDEAFERANDEVGIYEVRDVDLEVTDVPEPEGADDPDTSEGGPPGGAGDSVPTDAGRFDATTADAETSDATATGTRAPRETGAGTGASDATETGTGESGKTGTGATGEAATGESGKTGTRTTGEAGSGPTSRSSPQNQSSPGRESASESGGASGVRDARTEPNPGTPAETQPQQPTGGAAQQTAEDPIPGATPGATAESAAATQPETTDDPDASTESAATSDAPESAASEAADDASAFSEEAEWRETTTIPSLDPDRSEGPDDGAESKQRPSSGAPTDERAAAGEQSEPAGQADADRQSPSSPSASSGESNDATSAGDAEEADARARKLRSQLQQRTQQVEQLKDRLSTVESERDELERMRDALRQEVERLEAKLERASEGSSDADRQLSPSQALDGTNLFVRYQSKGEATLSEAASGDADAEAVNANLQLEHHTQFDTEGVDVDGRPFDEFLTDSFEYQFASWVVERLLYEIRETGHRGELRDLYDAIPEIDRVDLNGSVSAGTSEDDTRQESFDVIMRDRMGNPLLVADLNGSRDPTSGDMMGTLVDSATGVAEAHGELSGAFQVTKSFFEPEALETTETATAGGFLSREKRESFVKLSRKRGYHLCLVESRSGGFHLNVPEL